MHIAHVQRKLGFVFGGLLVATVLMVMPSGSTQTNEPIRFGMNLGSVDAQTSAGAKPDYGTFWVGPWTLGSGWGGPDRELDRAYASGTTPVIQFYYWGDDISPDCVENGCWSKLHDSWKDRAGWQRLAQELVDHLNAHMKGRTAIIVLETEFNKGGISTYEPFDGYLEEKARFIKQGYAGAQIVIGFGNWDSSNWKTFDRAVAASDYTGLQAMRGSTRNSLDSYRGLVDATLSGIRALRATFAKPVLVTDVALSSYPEPDYVDHQRAVVSSLFARLDEFRAAGVVGLIYRSYQDNPNFDTANYYGEAERHWGLAWAGSTGGKPAWQAWVEGVKAERQRTVAPAAVAPTPDFSYEAESAYHSTGGRSTSYSPSGGAAWNLWNNGYLEQTVRVTASGLYDIAVWARGNEAGGVKPHMAVAVDGKAILQADPPAGGYQAYRIAVALTAGEHKLRVSYTNDGTAGAEDRNLIVDRSTVGALARLEAESFTRSTTGARQSDAQASGGARWNLWSNGYVARDVQVPSNGSYELRLRVQGQLLGGVAPHAVVYWDGAPIGSADPGAGYRDVVVPVGSTSTGTHEVRVEFTNDWKTTSEDRNLLLDRVDLVRIA